jgi:hypothetical protein
MINHPNRSKSVPVIDITVARKVLEIVDAGLVRGVGNPVAGEMCVEAAVCFALGLPHGDDPKCVAPSLRQLKIRLNDARWSSNQARAKGLRRLALIQLGSVGHLDDQEFAKRCATLAIKTSVTLALRAAASIHKDPKHAQAMRSAAKVCETEGTRASALEAKKTTAYAATAAAAAAADADAAYAATYAADAATYAATAAAADAATYAATYAADAATYAATAAATAAAYAAYAADAATTAYAAYAAADAARDKSLADFAEGVVQILIEMGVPGVQWLQLTELAA